MEKSEVEFEAITIYNEQNEPIGHKEVISSWNILDIPQPTKEQLDAIDDSEDEEKKTNSLEEYQRNLMRKERDLLITETDWTQLDDTSIPRATKAKYKVYRQELRDITKQEGFPHNVVFPEKPV